MMNHYGSYGWNGWMLMAMVLWPVLIAAGIWAVVAVTRDRRATPERKPEGSPSDILKERLARGEISQQEYVETATILDNDTSRAAHG